MRSSRARLLAAGLVASCAGGHLDATSVQRQPIAAPAGEQAAADLPRPARYLRLLAPRLVARSASPQELAAVNEGDPAEALAAVLEQWGQEPGFAAAMRDMVTRKLSVSGERDGIDYNLPGRLVEQLVREGKGADRLLTHDHCAPGGSGQDSGCGTGAPWTAGVVGTRAYLASRASRFNLTRASTLLHTFACVGYPQPEQLQPRVAKTEIIPMFAAASAEEQTDPRARGGFGNGGACYLCHGQFAAHAQLFVRVDATGTYRPAATGLQDPDGELGKSTNGLFASHRVAGPHAAEESTQVFGVAAANLQEAAAIVAASPRFLPCMARNLLEYAFAVDADSVDLAQVASMLAAAGADQPGTSLQQLARALFSQPAVVLAATTR